MALQFRPCTGTVNGAPCQKLAWRVNPRLCSICYKRAQNSGAIPRRPRAPRGTGRSSGSSRRGAPINPQTAAAAGAAAGFTPLPSAHDALLRTLVAFEEAITLKAREQGLTQQLSDDFETYQKVKSRIIGGSTDGEKRAALRVAMRKLIDMAV